MNDGFTPGPGDIPIDAGNGITLYQETPQLDLSQTLTGGVGETALIGGVDETQLQGSVDQQFSPDDTSEKQNCPLRPPDIPLIPQIPTSASPPPKRPPLIAGIEKNVPRTPLETGTTLNTPRTDPKLKADKPKTDKPKKDKPKKNKPTKHTPTYWAHTDYGQGPVLDKTTTIAQCPGWSGLLQSGKITQQQQQIIVAVSGNEGGADSLQGWDDQVLTLGSMQKTANQNGSGELPNQIMAFSKQDPSGYQSMFVDHGWSVSQPTIVTKSGKTILGPPTLYYTDAANPAGITGKALKAYMKKLEYAYDPKGKKLAPALFNMLQPLQAAARSASFQQRQILDWQSRLNQVLNKKSNGFSLGAWSQGNLELQALLTDESVNRPAYVTDGGRNDFGRALTAFFNDPKNANVPPGVLRNPNAWTPAQRADFQQQIINQFRKTRSQTVTQTVKTKKGTKVVPLRPMTHANLRADNIHNFFHPPS